MRKLMWFSIGFTAGSIPVAYLAWHQWYLVAALACAVLGVAFFLCRHKSVKCAALVLLGITISLLWSWGYDALYLQSAKEIDGAVKQAQITATDYSYETDYGVAFDGRVDNYKVRVYLDDASPLSPGDTVTGQFRFRLTAVGGQEVATYHRAEGCFLLAYAQDEVTLEKSPSIPLRYFPAQLRQSILTVLDEAFPGDAAGFARALLLGDSTKLTYEEDTSFKVSGIRHVIAVSGLHVSILFALIYVLSGKHRVLTAVLGIPVLVLFAAVAGFSPSIVRACIMQSLMILALLFKKEYDPPTALSFAVLIMLVCNPMTVASVSFQLSVGCMVGIFLLCRRINEYLLVKLHCPKGISFGAKVVRWLAGSVAVTLSAMAVTTPLTVYYFGVVSIVGVITNLLCLWVVSFIFYGIILVCALGAIWIPLGKAVAWVVSWPVRYVLLVARTMAGIPLAAVYTCSIYVLLWVVFSYLCIGAFLLIKKKKPAMLALSIVVALVLALAASYTEPRLDSLRVTVIDVGQGQSILLQSQDQYYLVDCGGEDPENTADIVSQSLLSQGIFRLDGIFLTHYDGDHAGAVSHLLSRVKTDKLYLPDIADDSGRKDYLREQFSHCVEMVQGRTSFSGDWGTITAVSGDSAGDENENSLCVLFQAENCDILITGDRDQSAERKLLETLDLPQLELLVVGHHGSKSATSFELLSVTQPKNAVISVGKDNYYGHPAPELLARLEMFGCRIFRTDLEGTIVFRR